MYVCEIVCVCVCVISIHYFACGSCKNKNAVNIFVVALVNVLSPNLLNYLDYPVYVIKVC